MKSRKRKPKNNHGKQGTRRISDSSRCRSKITSKSSFNNSLHLTLRSVQASRGLDMQFTPVESLEGGGDTTACR